MKILLVNPPLSCTTSLSLAMGEPLGLAYIAAAIEGSGRHQVEILDGIGLASGYQEDIPDRKEMFDKNNTFWIGLSHQEMIERLRSMDFDAVGITLVRLHEAELEALPLAAAIRVLFPGIPVIVGGPEATLRALHYAGRPEFDFVVVGEGEITIIELLDHLEGRLTRDQLRGVAYRDQDGQPVMTPPQREADIETLPWPARRLLPMETYFRCKPAYTQAPAANILTSRACPFLCAFCGSSPVWGRRWRGRSPANVVDEIEFLVRHYGAREIRIQDDNFVVDRGRAEAICDAIVERRLDIALHIEPGVMLHLATKPLLRKLRAAGLASLSLQLESGIQKTQKYINKIIDIERAREMVGYAREIGMMVNSNIILGFFFETAEDMRESAEVAMNIGYSSLSFLFPFAMPHTRLRADCIAQGLIREDVSPTYPLATLYASSHEVQQTINWANEEFRRRRMPPTPIVGKTLVLEPAWMERRDGYCWHVALSAEIPGGDVPERWGSSSVRLYEDSCEIGPGHSGFPRIRDLGRGRFSHRPQTLFFSSSDGTDPRDNGRVYEIRY